MSEPTRSLDPELDPAVDVVVVGAGPVGLLLAGELRRGDADVLVLERRAAPITESRATTLHARTMEILDSRGLLPGLGDPPVDRRGHLAGLPLDLTLPSSHPGQWKVPQARTEAVLAQWATGSGVVLRRAAEVTGVQADPEGVDVVVGDRERLRARYLVACDGEESTVRRLIGAEFPGQDAGRELLRADVAGITVPERRFQRLPAGFAVAARRPDGVTRVMVHETGSRPQFAGHPPELELSEYAAVVKAWYAVTGEDISTGTPLWVNAFGDSARHLSAYRHGRVLFAGDAAHRQMPIGGQALNLGLQDAFNLGWKLARRLRGGREAVLDSYHAERHPVGARVLTNIRAQATLLLGGPEVEPVRALLAELLDLPEVVHSLAGTISGLDVRYEIGQDHPLAGARLPGIAPLLRSGSGSGLLLDLTGGEHERRLREAARGYPVRVVGTDLPAPGDRAPAEVALVRPDGHVAWVGMGGLAGALDHWFGTESVDSS